MKIITCVQWFCGLDGVIDVARVVNDPRDMAEFDVICMQEVAVNYPAWTAMLRTIGRKFSSRCYRVLMFSSVQPSMN